MVNLDLMKLNAQIFHRDQVRQHWFLSREHGKSQLIGQWIGAEFQEALHLVSAMDFETPELHLMCLLRDHQKSASAKVLPPLDAESAPPAPSSPGYENGAPVETIAKTDDEAVNDYGDGSVIDDGPAEPPDIKIPRGSCDLKWVEQLTVLKLTWNPRPWTLWPCFSRTMSSWFSTSNWTFSRTGNRRSSGGTQWPIWSASSTAQK